MTADPRLRAALDAAAAGPVPDAWDLIRTRVADGAGPEVVAAPESHRPARWAVPAAAALVVALLAGVALVGGDEGATPVTAGPATAPASPATGWYAPLDLPDGWRLVEAGVAIGQVVCDAEGARWADADVAFAVERSTCPDLVLDERLPSGPEVDLGDGVEATSTIVVQGDDGTAPRLRSLTWVDGNGLWTVQGWLLGAADLTEVARSVREAGSVDIPPRPGLDRLDRWERPVGEQISATLRLESPDGQEVDVLLAPPGATDGAGNRHPRADATAPPLPYAEEAGLGPDRPGRGDPPRSLYVGAWPGADVRVSLDLGRVADAPTFDGADVAVLLAAMAPASTEQWRAFLATAEGEVDPALTSAPTLADLGD